MASSGGGGLPAWEASAPGFWWAGAPGFWWAQDPSLWVGLAALFAGIAVGQALRAFISIREPRVRSLGARSARIARAIAFLSLGLLAFTGLLIFADKGAIETAMNAPFAGGAFLLPWACVAAALGLLAGFRPLALGLPIIALAAGSCVLLSLCLAGWLPFHAASGEGYRIARLMPYEVGASSFRGQLETAERDSVPVLQELSLDSSSVSLVAESLELVGPLGFAAKVLASAGRISYAARGSYEASARFYRIVGLGAPGGPERAFAPPPSLGVLDAVLTAGGTRAIFGLVKRTRCASEPIALAALEPVHFSIDAEGLRIIGK
jgi:hypothetical protein